MKVGHNFYLSSFFLVKVSYFFVFARKEKETHIIMEAGGSGNETIGLGSESKDLFFTQNYDVPCIIAHLGVRVTGSPAR